MLVVWCAYRSLLCKLVGCAWETSSVLWTSQTAVPQEAFEAARGVSAGERKATAGRRTPLNVNWVSDPEKKAAAAINYPSTGSPCGFYLPNGSR